MRKVSRGRILAGILAAVMMCTAAPGTAYAVESEAFEEVNGESVVYAASGNGVVDKLNELKNKYSHGKYWHKVNGQNAVTSTPCVHPDGTVYTCNQNAVNGCGNTYLGWQCVGLASQIYSEIFGQNIPDYRGNRTDAENIMVGDYVRIRNNTHSFIVAARNGNVISGVECNWSGPCQIGWGQQHYISEVTGFCHATNYDQIANISPDPIPIVGSDMSAPFTRTIADGDYHIVTALDDSMCLDVAGASKEDGANVQIYHGTEDELQVFTVTWLGVNKGYKIIHRNSGKSLDVAGRSRTAGTNVWQWEYFNPSEHTQDWVINEVDNGAYYTVQSRGSGFYLDVDGGTAADGTNVKIWTGNGSTAQKWRFIPAGTQMVANGDYYIATALDGSMCLNVQGASISDEANVEIARKKGQDSQIFTVTYLHNGFYKILNKHSGKSLDVYIGSAVRGTNVQQYGYHGGLPQQWTIRDAGGGSYYIQPRCSGHYLDVANGSTAEGTNVWTTVWMGGAAAQRWKLVPAEKQKLAPPTADIPSGTEVEAGTKVSLSCGVEGATIYYTLDGTIPTAESLCYSDPIVIERDIIIMAMVVKDGYTDSGTTVYRYTVKKENSPDDPDEPEQPETPGRGEVLEEDVPQGKVENIPRGLWMSEVLPQTYTGKAIKPKVRVYDYKKLLVEKRDYTISYKNNGKANASSGKNPPTITVTGKGNYTGKEIQTFEILPKQLTDDDITADSLTVSYNGRAQKPFPVVTWNGRKLVRNRDYKTTHPYAKQAGVYQILLKGMGNYSGERLVDLTITHSTPVSKLRVDKIANQMYTGAALTPIPVVKKGRTVLKQGEDYTLSYQNNVEVGTAFVIVTGKGEYAGEKRASFRIVAGASLKNGKAELNFAHPAVYTGGEVKPDGYRVTVPVKMADGNKAEVTLAEGTDFTVSYKNNSRPGTATILFQGINGYTGTLKKTYKISAYNIAEDVTGADGKIQIEMADSYAYTKGGCKPEPVVTFQGTTLKKGTDYTLSYKNNTALNDGSNPRMLPAVKIKGKGCFTGEREVTYKITAKNIGDLTMTASDKVWQNKRNSYRTNVVIRDADGRALRAGTDYEKVLRYEYEADVIMPDGTLRKAGEEISGKDILPAGTKIWVTASAKGGNYTGTLAGSYRITKFDIGKARVTIPAQTYTGREIRPEKEMQVKLNGKALSGDNYEITGYANNVNKGTATVTIKGKNDCGGVKTVRFRIKGKGFRWWWK